MAANPEITRLKTQIEKLEALIRTGDGGPAIVATRKDIVSQAKAKLQALTGNNAVNGSQPAARLKGDAVDPVTGFTAAQEKEFKDKLDVASNAWMQAKKEKMDESSAQYKEIYAAFVKAFEEYGDKIEAPRARLAFGRSDTAGMHSAASNRAPTNGTGAKTGTASAPASGVPANGSAAPRPMLPAFDGGSESKANGDAAAAARAAGADLKQGSDKAKPGEDPKITAIRKALQQKQYSEGLKIKLIINTDGAIKTPALELDFPSPAAGTTLLRLFQEIGVEYTGNNRKACFKPALRSRADEMQRAGGMGEFHLGHCPLTLFEAIPELFHSFDFNSTEAVKGDRDIQNNCGPKQVIGVPELDEEAEVHFKKYQGLFDLIDAHKRIKRPAP